MKPWLSAEASTVAAKLRAGEALRMQVVDRPGSRCQLRLGFSPTDLVAPPAVEALLRRGLAVLCEDGAIRHGIDGGPAGAPHPPLNLTSTTEETTRVDHS